MRSWIGLVLGVGMLLPAGLVAQRAGMVAEAAAGTPWVYGALAQGGVGLGTRSDFGFLTLGAHVGKVLLHGGRQGALEGSFEYGVEVLPLWQAYTPTFSRIKCPAGAVVATQCSAPYTVGGTYTGVSVTPIILRYNLTHGRRVMPWVQAAGGFIYTTHKFPAVGDLNAADPTQTGPQANTSVFNFSPQGGAGVHYFVAARRSVDVGVNFIHISSASLGDKNPGVNSSAQFSVGYSWWR